MNGNAITVSLISLILNLSILPACLGSELTEQEIYARMGANGQAFATEIDKEIGQLNSARKIADPKQKSLKVMELITDRVYTMSSMHGEMDLTHDADYEYVNKLRKSAQDLRGLLKKTNEKLGSPNITKTDKIKVDAALNGIIDSFVKTMQQTSATARSRAASYLKRSELLKKGAIEGAPRDWGLAVNTATQFSKFALSANKIMFVQGFSAINYRKSKATLEKFVATNGQ